LIELRCDDVRESVQHVIVVVFTFHGDFARDGAIWAIGDGLIGLDGQTIVDLVVQPRRIDFHVANKTALDTRAVCSKTLSSDTSSMSTSIPVTVTVSKLALMAAVALSTSAVFIIRRFIRPFLSFSLVNAVAQRPVPRFEVPKSTGGNCFFRGPGHSNQCKHPANSRRCLP
jgi:hypothetical protein